MELANDALPARSPMPFTVRCIPDAPAFKASKTLPVPDRNHYEHGNQNVCLDNVVQFQRQTQKIQMVLKRLMYPEA